MTSETSTTPEELSWATNATPEELSSGKTATPEEFSGTNATLSEGPLTISTMEMKSWSEDSAMSSAIVAIIVIGVLLIIGLFLYLLYMCYLKPGPGAEDKRNPVQDSLGFYKPRTMESMTKLKIKLKRSKMKISKRKSLLSNGVPKSRIKSVPFGFPNLPPPQAAASQPRNKSWNIAHLLKRQEETEAKMNSLELEPVRHPSDDSVMSELMIVRTRMTNEEPEGGGGGGAAGAASNDQVDQSPNSQSSLTLTRSASSKSQGKSKTLPKTNPPAGSD